MNPTRETCLKNIRSLFPWSLALAIALISTLLSTAVTQAQTLGDAGEGLAEPESRQYGGSYKADITYSAEAPISQGTLRLGDVDPIHNRVRYMGKIRVNDTYSWRAGINWERYSFGTPVGSPIPDTLQTVAAALGNTWHVADNWILQFEAEPGIYSDFEDISIDDFNAPLVARAIYSPNPNLQWLFAIVGNFRNQFPVVGGVGVRWKFADQWTLSLAIPKPVVEFQATDALMLFAGGEFSGSAFRVAKDFGTRTGRPGLNDQDITYREIRVGAGLQYTFSKRIIGIVEAGWMVDRRFVYDDRDLQLNGDGAPFFKFGIVGSY